MLLKWRQWFVTDAEIVLSPKNEPTPYLRQIEGSSKRKMRRECILLDPGRCQERRGYETDSHEYPS